MIEADKNVEVALTDHATKRISKRFDVSDFSQIKNVLAQAMTNGLISIGERSSLIEFGCALMAGELKGGKFTITTVYNLSSGISSELKHQLRDVKPTPWESAEVRLPEGEGVEE